MLSSPLWLWLLPFFILQAMYHRPAQGGGADRRLVSRGLPLSLWIPLCTVMPILPLNPTRAFWISHNLNRRMRVLWTSLVENQLGHLESEVGHLELGKAGQGLVHSKCITTPTMTNNKLHSFNWLSPAASLDCGSARELRISIRRHHNLTSFYFFILLFFIILFLLII